VSRNRAGAEVQLEGGGERGMARPRARALRARTSRTTSGVRGPDVVISTTGRCCYAPSEARSTAPRSRSRMCSARRRRREYSEPLGRDRDECCRRPAACGSGRRGGGGASEQEIETRTLVTARRAIRAEYEGDARVAEKLDSSADHRAIAPALDTGRIHDHGPETQDRRVAQGLRAEGNATCRAERAVMIAALTHRRPPPHSRARSP